jgi:hypothetical protein
MVNRPERADRYTAGFFGAFGCLGFGGLFGVLSPTADLLLLRLRSLDPVSARHGRAAARPGTGPAHR